MKTLVSFVSLLSVLAVSVYFGLAVTAQEPTPAINPTTAQFTASPKHDELTVGGTPKLTKYVLEIYDGGTMVRATDLGKPTPNGGVISVPLAQAGLKNNTVYRFHILSQGPGGEERSATPSNPFAWEVGELPGAASNLVAR